MLYGIYSLGENKYQLIIDEKGEIKKKIIEYKPCLYVKSDNIDNVKYVDFYNKSLKKVVFQNEYEYKKALTEYKKKKIDYCGDIATKYQALASYSNKIDFSLYPIVAYNYDIEAFNLDNDNYCTPQSATNPIQSITIQNMFTNKYLVLGYKDYDITDIHRYDKDNTTILFTVKKEDITYLKCENERLLLKKFISILKKNVNVITGYNILSYDNMYIISRCKKLGIEKEFIDKCKMRENEAEFGFMENIDAYPSIKKFKNDTLENNSLDTVAKAYLGYGKIEFTEGFRTLYINDYKKFIDYNIIDVALVYMLEQKLSIMKLMFNMSNSFFCNATDTMSLTTYVDTAIYKEQLDNNIIVPAKKSNMKEPYVGGFVLEPIRGISFISANVDIISSYPTNGRRNNISVETLICYNNLQPELLEIVLKHKFRAVKEVYSTYKEYYRTKDGSLKFDKNHKKVDHNNCALHFLQDDNKKDIELHKLTYPRFFIDYDNSLFDEENSDVFFTKVDNKYNRIFFIMDYDEAIEHLTKNNREFNKDFFAISEMLVTENLIEYFSEDHKRFDEFTPYLQKNNMCMTCNLQFFDLSRVGILAKFQEDNFFKRVKFKKLSKDYDCLIDYIKTKDVNSKDKIKNKEILVTTDIVEAKKLGDNAELNNNTLKVVINGSYGFQATEKSRYYNKHIGESITASGQLCIRGVSRYLEKNKLIESLYGDTDARVISPHKETYCELLAKIANSKNRQEIANLILDWYKFDILPKINQYFAESKILLNTRDVDIEFDLETIQLKTLFTDKKKYSWLLLYKDGIVFEGDKFKHKGLGFVKSDCPPWCRSKLKKFVELTLTTENPKLLKAYILKCKEVYEKQNILTISKPVSVKTLDDYCSDDNGIPAGVDAALNYNKFINDQRLKQYNPIVAGSKIKWIYIDPKNSYGFDKIAIIDGGAIEEIKKYFVIDYKKQFESTFMSLPERIFEVCGWNLNTNKNKNIFS